CGDSENLITTREASHETDPSPVLAAVVRPPGELDGVRRGAPGRRSGRGLGPPTYRGGGLAARPPAVPARGRAPLPERGQRLPRVAARSRSVRRAAPRLPGRPVVPEPRQVPRPAGIGPRQAGRAARRLPR